MRDTALPVTADSPENALRIFRASKNWIFDRSVGIYRQMPNGGNPVMEGSGVLLQIADARFLLSAAHVLKASTEAALSVAPMTPGSRMIHIDSSLQFIRDEDTVDLGFARLSDNVADELIHHGKKFVRLTNIDRYPEPVPGFYSVLGYPANKNNPNYEAKRVEVLPIAYGTYLHDGDVEYFTPGVSIAVSWKQDTVTLPDGDVERRPNLLGISGCGMWRLYGAGDRIDRLDTWEATWIRLAGIEHKWVERKYVKGTLLRYVLDLIERAHPDLTPALRLTTRA